jgi:hypothetical protein
MSEFTFEMAIKIQTQQLNEWKIVLKPEVHARLVELVTKDNNTAKRPHDIVRGTYIENIIYNKLIYNHQ